VVKDFQGVEGVCLYYNNDQNIRKIKSLDYLKRHAFKSDCTVKNIISLWSSYGRPVDQDVVLERIEKEFDYECSVMAMPVIRQIWPFVRQVDRMVNQELPEFVRHRELLDQKSFALEVQERYKGSESGICFSLRAGKAIDDKIYEKYLGSLIEKDATKLG